MPSKFTAKQRLKLVERAIRGEKVSSLCQEVGISRTLLYRWIKRYREDQRKNKILALKPRKRHSPLSLSTPPDKIKLILKIVQNHPEFSVAKIVQTLPKGPTGSHLVGYHGVQKVLERLDLNTIEKRQNYQKQPQILQDYKLIRTEILGLPWGELSPQDRLAMIERVKLGEPVARVCKLYGVSRTVFYRWLKRYEEALEGKKLEALWNRKPIVEKYFNQASEEYEQAVLAAVREYPELSSHKIVYVLPKVGERPILGNHGVQNVLARHNLTLYEERLAYAQAYHRPTFFTRFFKIPNTALSYIGSLMPSVRKSVVRGSFVLAIGIFAGVIIYGITSLARILTSAPTLSFSLGMVFSLLSLGFGMFFFLYSLKYYFTIAAVLSFSRRSLEEETEEDHGSFWAKFFGVANNNHNSHNAMNSRQPIFAGGLQPDLSKIVLQRKPFVSIHLATYNEKRVVERLLTAATSMEYENYEVVLVDDSTDETLEILKKWADHPRVKLIHRDSRAGFKGGALREALKNTSPKAEFVLIFDADFIPYPDTIVQFLKYFQSLTGGLGKEALKDTKIAAIQGYQWHVLNKSENWVTRGVRSEYAGSYVIERSGTEIYQGLKQIAGSVYMMRADVLRQLGWGSSITEDFELTLKLYEQGYKVVYTPYIQAPAEAVSTLRRLIRQRMRWAEGHSHNIKKMFLKLFRSPRLSFIEKLEFLYLSPYYLQAFFFMLGTFSWFMAEVVFRVRLPFWTELWGWSLIFTNILALPLMNMVGLFLEESEEKDYLGLFSFIALSYIVAPFQGYASLKGFLSKEEGPWFRTPKTGKITDIFTPGRFYRFIFGVFGRPAFTPQQARGFGEAKPALSLYPKPYPLNPYLAFSTAHNRSNFKIRPRHLRWLGKTTLASLLIISLLVFSLSQNVQVVHATNVTSPLKLGLGAANDSGEAWPSGWNSLENSPSYPASGGVFILMNNQVGYRYWAFNSLPTGGDPAIIPSGNYYLNLVKQGGPPNKNTINYGIMLTLEDVGGTTGNVILMNQFYVNNSRGTYGGDCTSDNTVCPHLLGTLTSNLTITSPQNRLTVSINGGGGSKGSFNWVLNNTSARSELILPSNIQVPELSTIIFITFLAIMPALPGLVSGRFRKEGRNIFEEFTLAWRSFVKELLGQGEESLDRLPV